MKQWTCARCGAVKESEPYQMPEGWSWVSGQSEPVCSVACAAACAQTRVMRDEVTAMKPIEAYDAMKNLGSTPEMAAFSQRIAEALNGVCDALAPDAPRNVNVHGAAWGALLEVLIRQGVDPAFLHHCIDAFVAKRNQEMD